jgi:outer membrane receptor protein involved in Fe transport
LKSQVNFLIVLFTLVNTIVPFYGQTAIGKGTVVGAVVDASNEKPIEFATISVHSAKDSSLLTGTITGSDGKFSIDNVPFGPFYLRASFIGYEKFQSGVYKITPEKMVVSIPVIQLKTASGVLDAVNIEVERGNVELHIDKKVYNTDKDLDSKGGSAVDVLRNIPSVDIDEEDNVSLRGDGSVQVLIDGRPSSIPLNILLRQIPASDIEKVELITNPGAKYDPEGMAGIINIILKKSKQKGFNGSANAGYGQGILNNYNGGVSLNWRREKFNYTVNANHNNNPHWNEGRGDRTTYFTDSTYRLMTDSEGKWVRSNNMVKGGIDYFVNEKNTVYASGTYSFGTTTSDNDNSYKHFGNGELFQNSTAFSIGNGTNQNFAVNTGWQSTIGKKLAMDFDVNYDQNQSYTTTNNTEYKYNVNPLFNTDPIRRTIIQDNFNDVLLGRLDFTLPINDSLQVEFGSRVTIENENTDFIGTNFNYVTNQDEIDTLLSNNFKYNQSVYAGYFTFAHRIRKWGYKAGLRAEQTFTTADLVSSNEQPFTNDYFNIFPSVHVSYQFSDVSEVQLSYSKRIKRPSSHEVNPFANYSDPYFIRVGNPFLLPEQIDVIEMNYSQRFKKFWSFNGSLYYRMIDDQIRRYSRVEDNLFIMSFNNLQDSKVGGTEFSLNYRKKSFSSMLTGNYWYSIINDSELIRANVPSYGWSANWMTNYKFKNDTRLQANLVYRGGMMMAQGYIMPRYNFNLSVSHSFLNKNLQVTLGVRDIFRTMFFNVQSREIPNLEFNNYRYFDSRRVTLAVSYNFGKQAQQARQKRKLKNDDNDSGLPDM